MVIELLKNKRKQAMKFIFDRKKFPSYKPLMIAKKTKPKYILAIFYIYYLVLITLFVYSTRIYIYIYIYIEHLFFRISII